MGKFCGYCGARITDTEAFCHNCGTNIQQTTGVQQGQYQTTPLESATNALKKGMTSFSSKTGNGKKKLWVALGAVAMVAVVIVSCVFIFGPTAYEKAINNQIDAVIECDYDSYIACRPDDYWDNHDKPDEDDFESVAKRRLKTIETQVGEDVDISYEITDEEKYDNFSLSDIPDLISIGWNVDKDDITEAVKLDVDFKIKGSKKTEKESSTIVLVKIDGDWYVWSGLNLFFKV